MQFLRLRLNGFKSFVDPTELVITEGLTGIVGPNGCGKSNLLEAVRWVMGENRPTAMRGEGMEDIIFAGAASRPARYFAEVVLNVDNQSRRAPAIFNDEPQIEIIRRVTREIGSAYKVNGNDARARDVQMLFADACIGAHSPALVRQGQIAELINARPKTRRLILEQAAGISGLHQRRHEAELKLKASENNLARVDDILQTLATQRATLERQARQGARYREIGKNLRDSEARLLYRRWWDATKKLEGESASLNAAIQAFATMEAKRAKAARLRGETNASVAPLRTKQADAQAALQRITLEQSNVESERQRTEEMIGDLAKRLEQVESDIARAHQLGEDAKKTLEELAREEQALVEKSTPDDAGFEQAEKHAQAALHALESKEGEAAKHSEHTAGLAAQYDACTRRVTDYAQNLEKHERALENAQSANQHSHDQSQKATLLLKEKADALSRAKDAAEQSEEALAKAEKSRAQIQSEQETSRAQLATYQSAEKALFGERDALETQIKHNVENSQALLGHITVETGFEAALGAAFDDELNSSAEKGETGNIWQELAQYDAPAPLPEGASPLANHIRFPAVLSRRMSQIGLVDAALGAKLQSSLKPGQRLVSKRGDLWRWDGFIALAKEQPKAAAFRLQQINRIKSLKQECEKAHEKSQTMQKSHEKLNKAFEAARVRETEARQAERTANDALNLANRDYAHAQGEQSLTQARLKELEDAIAHQDKECVSAKRALEEAQSAQDALPCLATAREGAEKLHKERNEMRALMLDKTRAFEALKQTIEAQKRRLEELKAMRVSWVKRLESARAQMTDMQKRREELARELENAKAHPEELRKKHDALAQALEESKRTEAHASAALHKAEIAATEADNFERSANKAANEAGEARARAETKAETAREALGAIVEHIAHAHKTTPEALATGFDIDTDSLEMVDALEAQLGKLKRQRDALGAVNLRAEEDAEAIRNEYDALAHEKNDLDEAISKLRKAIANLNREGRGRLLKAFEAVNVNFEKLFTTLFNGGTGRLEMVESDDPLEAGLEIICQPPGKKLSSLSLLSGGEQTLSALALIFAVFLVNPAPICVLDEVDAPLDDVNIARFCDLLDKLCEQTTTRFLIITHHPITMARMDRLYGVTMAEKGVSQLVSVDLNVAEKMVS